MRQLLFVAAWAVLGPAGALMASSPWPAEPNSQAVKLTALDPAFNASNMSGAAWNPVTRAFWLANNSGQFWALVEDGAGSFKVATNSAGAKARWSPGGDLESICQADFSQPLAYLLDENGWIREYDDNLNGEAILWFRQFQPVADTDADSLADDWELRYFGTTTHTVGSADSDLDRMTNAAEQTAGTDPTDASSVFRLLSAVLTADHGALVLSWPSVAGRTYEVRQAAGLQDDFTQVVEAAIAATPPVNVSTVAVSAAIGGAFYRLAVRAP